MSPVLHRAAYRALGLVGWGYEAIEVSGADDLAALVTTCSADPAWAGLSLTMPLKRLVQPLLHSQSEAGLISGSVNTVVFVRDGGSPGVRLEGHNTDVIGIVRALRGAGVGGSRGPVSTAVVLGGGATASSAVVALSLLGASVLTTVARSTTRAAALVPVGEQVGVTVRLAPWPTGGSGADGAVALVRDEILDADVVISTVPGSAAPQVLDLLRDGRPRGVLLDVTYDPWPTPVAQAWSDHGGPSGAATVAGLEMLLHQAGEQVHLMTGARPPVGPMRDAGLTELARRGRCG